MMPLSLLAIVLPLGAGDLHLPKNVTKDTPCLLLIHGGGWTEMNRRDVVGVADYFSRDLGFAVYNIDYRLATQEHPWPACGEDCVASAKFMFTEAFAHTAGVRPQKIWIAGASAGGHLALWTGLSLPSDWVAGIVSISGIVDPMPDFSRNPGRYRALFGGQDPTAARLDAMNPLRLIRPNGPPVLLTHATGDKVVPIASARNFEKAYRDAGNPVEFYEYPSEIELGLSGHSIWRSNGKPRRLITALERTIADFVLPPRVPTPQPVKGAVEVHAFYYPGTEQRWEWDLLERTRPHLKPLLGWYDETDPEVVDWQIKWAVEHGISAFCVDWYWNRGERRLEHWVRAYDRAKHRRFLKWYMMYANHNEPGAHDEADTRRLVQYWIENYFRTPGYYRIEGKPVVVIWASDRFGEDFAEEAARRGETITAEEGLRRAIALMQSLVCAAGFPGIHFIDMYHGGSYDPRLVNVPREAGYSAQMIYNFDTIAWNLAPEARQPGDRKDNFGYSLIRPAVNRWWAMTSRDPAFPFWPIVPTGWNDQPRSFEKARVIRNRTPEAFREILSDCRAFCETNGFTRCIIAPINEWQEGSYIEPNEEYGFAMYDAIREVFCEKPTGGWPKNVRPQDVGCGPYDFPEIVRPSVTSWDFDAGVQGWCRNPYATASVRNEAGALHYFRSESGLPAVCTKVAPFNAQTYARLRFRARILPDPRGVPSWFTHKYPDRKRGGSLIWSTPGNPIIHVNAAKDEISVTKTNRLSFETIPDGAWHSYDIDLSSASGWRGAVDEIWFDVDNFVYTKVWIDNLEFVSTDK